MGLYEVPLSMSLLAFEMGTMLTNFYMFGIMLMLRAVFNMLVRNASSRGPMCFRRLMFSLSGPCVLLFLLCFIASCGECDGISLYFMCCSVNGPICIVLRVCELFGETISKMFACGWRCSVGCTVYGPLKNVCVVPVIAVCI